MEVEPQIFNADVMHHRHHPKAHGFRYHSSYISLPITKNNISSLDNKLAINRFAPLSFYESDHGKRDGSNLHDWAQDILKKEALDKVTKHIVLITLPRIFGYVFNPVSFWLCLDEDNNMRALISEVNNTFGDSHTYLCAKHDKKAIDPNEWLSSEKLLYVSPFLKREGSYKFRISYQGDKLGIFVNHLSPEGQLLLSTSLCGELNNFSKKALGISVLKLPFTAIKTISLIHWQALKLWLKGIRYVPRPTHDEASQSAHLEKSDTTHHNSSQINKAP